MDARLSKLFIRSQYVLLIAGISLLGYCALLVCTASYYQAEARQQLSLKVHHLATLSSSSRDIAAPLRQTLQAAPALAVVGRVDVPRISLSAMVAEGDNAWALRMAVGHVPGTALPWQSGNVALVAHRDTFFRRIGELRVGDVIRLTIPGAAYTYRVAFTDVVNPSETWVLWPASGDTLTLVTCYPFHFIGPAPKRFVVRARRIDGAAARDITSLTD